MNLKSIFENLDEVIGSVAKGIDSFTKDLGKLEKEFAEDVEKANFRREKQQKQDKDNIEKIFGSKKTKLF